jgi:cysteine desulfuration protein SufE
MLKKRPGSEGIEGMVAYLDEMHEGLSQIPRGIETIELLIDYGRRLGPFPEEEKTDPNRVPSCVSNVYIIGAMDEKGRMHYRGSSESLVVGGYVSILIQALDGLEPRDVVEKSEAPIRTFLERTGLRANLTPSRANAFGNVYLLMVKKASDRLHDQA